MVIALGIASAAIWVYLLCARGGFWLERDSRAVKGRFGRVAPRVCAVVTARNEAGVVRRSMASLGAQLYNGEFQVVLVDDHSTDETAQIAREMGCHVISSASLAAGWTGKLWAVSQGIDYAARFMPDYFLLTDADIVHPRENVAALTLRAETDGYELVSYMATLECRTLAERALIPAFVFFFFLLYPPAWVRDSRRSTAGAAGGCILIRRQMLEKIGGIAAIRGELIDDCALASAVKRHGGRVWLGLNRDSVSIRDYAGFGEIGRMISRTAFTQLRYSALLLAGTVAGLILTYAVPPVLALAAVGWPRGLGVLSWTLMSIAYVPMLRYYRRSPLWAPVLPAVAVFYAGATIHSAICYWRGKGGMWKGRTHRA